MRMLLKVEMDTAASNEAIREGSIQGLMQEAVGRIRPEAAYFTVENGCRTGYFFFDLTETSDLPAIAEPFFMRLGARIHYSPVMNPDELAKGLAAITTRG
ncbi:hypothetical protein ACFFSH_36505 [Streptomyces filamentosus]|uniref:Uncharacterized protein n=1 Tax=Streptomyces filamentosus TaxID=67294 RepID=A0A919EG52_STRFL|nr:hypothetical protein [Streptomyces filamentosus]KAA6211298.1 hypothetical protein CP979_33290 [Streptomyces filamentosus]GHF78858.1 hypothetical protein GCM10017667_02850 [Streptomyces filamentosus]